MGLLADHVGHFGLHIELSAASKNRTRVYPVFTSTLAPWQVLGEVLRKALASRLTLAPGYILHTMGGAVCRRHQATTQHANADANADANVKGGQLGVKSSQTRNKTNACER